MSHSSGEVYTMPPFEIENLDRALFGAGGLDVKYLLTAEQEGQSVSYIARLYEESLVESWSAFQRAGLPVVRDLYTTEVNGIRMLLLPDLKAEGGELYGNNFHAQLNDRKIGRIRHRPPDPSVDQHFMQLTEPGSMATIIEHTEHYAKQATRHNLQLPGDDAFQLLVHKDGGWALCLLDIAQGSINVHDPRLQIINDDAADFFINSLYHIRNIFVNDSRRSPSPSPYGAVTPALGNLSWRNL